MQSPNTSLYGLHLEEPEVVQAYDDQIKVDLSTIYTSPTNSLFGYRSASRDIDSGGLPVFNNSLLMIN